MSGPSIAPRTGASIESATTRLTDTILGAVEQDLAEILRAIAAEIGLCHIAYLRLSPDKSADICLLVAVVTLTNPLIFSDSDWPEFMSKSLRRELSGSGGRDAAFW